jgi:1-acyl-sn-glycerol-3-phosphate acyltransferase
MILIRFLLSVYFWSWVVISSVLLFPVCLVVWAFTRNSDPSLRALNKISCLWGAIYIWCNPLWRARIEGREKIDSEVTTLYVCNHQSTFDIYLLFRLFKPFHWVTKRSNFYVPCIGWNMVLMRSIGFDREDRKEVLRMVKESVKRLGTEGISLIIFPEGERTPNGRLLPFLGGAFSIAKRADVRIQPMVLNGCYRLLPRYHFLVKATADLSLKVLDPIPVEVVREKSADELAELTWNLMAAELPPEALPLPEERETEEKVASV